MDMSGKRSSEGIDNKRNGERWWDELDNLGLYSRNKEPKQGLTCDPIEKTIGKTKVNLEEIRAFWLKVKAKKKTVSLKVTCLVR